ncbi:uncharacterized protein VTP21DRAFT_9806 [Calcarisporiella thermophila]|uniref:uncharacterized protein n=1 Tax=Calcarisporiella thermophila TaxID=911321 RepID=UPI0037448F8E
MATEWEDILIQKGILKRSGPTDEELREQEDEMILEAKAKESSLEDRTLEELDELEDEEDERILHSYRMKRIAEMQEAALRNKYGEVVQISKPDYTNEVTETSKNAWVVVHLFKDYIPACKLMNQHLATLAQRHKDVKFVKIVSDQCIPNYPDANVPTLLIYGEGDLRQQLVGAIAFGGMKMTVESLENQLRASGAISEGKEEKTEKSEQKIIYSNATSALSDEDEESDYD